MNINSLNSKKRQIFFIIIFAAFSNFIRAQVFHPGRPIFNPSIDTIFVPEISITADDISFFQVKKANSSFKQDEFAIPIATNISAEDYGIWYSFPKLNKKIWLLAINAPQAQSINLILNPFNLLQGSKLFFYDSSQTQVLGAITFLNNKPTDILPLSIINGQKIYCELQMPLYANDYGSFTISQVSIEPKSGSQLKSVEDKYFGRSESCNVNVNCNRSSGVQLQKNAVCRIVYSGTKRCSGTLINNLDNDGTPYVLTAAHCVNTDYLASTAVFYFNYESPTCENIDGTNHSISGSTLIAAGYHVPNEPDSLDFALLKLSEMPPLSYFPYYSGWDATGIVPDSTFSIHHPQGDIKKISVDSEMPSTSSAGNGFDDNTHWYIMDYDYGTTESGSSGGGLIDNNLHLIGTLTLGNPACSEIMSDNYQKLAHAYNDYSDEKYQLKKWLDPSQTGKLICDGFDAAGVLKNSAQSLTNFFDSDTLTELKNTTGWGYISGHNYQNNYLFAEHFTIKGSKYLYGGYFTPSVAYFTNSSQMVNFFIRKGGVIPGKVLYEKTIPLNEIDPCYPYYINFDSTILVSNDFYFGYQIGYDTDTFAVYTIKADADSNTAFTFLDGSWKPLQFNGKTYPCHLAGEVLAFDFMPEKGVLVDTSTFANITLYPNPVREQVQVFIKGHNGGEITISLYDISGRPIKAEKYIDYDSNIPFLLNVQRGIYILQIKIEKDKPESFKILVE